MLPFASPPPPRAVPGPWPVADAWSPQGTGAPPMGAPRPLVPGDPLHAIDELADRWHRGGLAPGEEGPLLAALAGRLVACASGGGRALEDGLATRLFRLVCSDRHALRRLEEPVRGELLAALTRLETSSNRLLALVAGRARREILLQPATHGSAIEIGLKPFKEQHGSVRASVLLGASGQCYVVSNTQRRGGYGKFRLALDEAGHAWAIKEYRSPMAHSRSNRPKVTPVSQIQSEVAMTSSVGNGLRIRDAIDIDGKIYTVMPLMAGDMAQLAREGKIPPSARVEVARSVLRQLAAELLKLHDHGFVHRDVKPGNALWTEDGRIVLADFGFVARRPPGGALTGVTGTSGYSAPELLAGLPYGEAVDTWVSHSASSSRGKWSCPSGTDPAATAPPRRRSARPSPAGGGRCSAGTAGSSCPASVGVPRRATPSSPRCATRTPCCVASCSSACSIQTPAPGPPWARCSPSCRPSSPRRARPSSACTWCSRP